MKNSIYLLAILILFGCAEQSHEEKELPKIAIAGLAIESSTFSPALSDEKAFKARRGEEVFTYYPFMREDSILRNSANWVPTLRAHAIPGGAVKREVYEKLVEETLEKLRADLPYDGLFFDIHGAMSVVGLDDPEGDFIKRVREVVGYETLISTSMDLHGSVSHDLAQNSDLITCYRMAPHEDAIESKRRAVTNLLDRLESGKGKPAYKAWVRVPILLPGEKTSTRIEPGKGLYAKVPGVEAKPGVIDAAIWMSYPWADEPRNHGVIMVTGDGKEDVEEGAKMLAQSFWDVRDEFVFVAPTATLDESLEMALQSEESPFLISDMGDNPTAGGAGDVTWTLKELLARDEFKSESGPSLIYASIPGPKLVKKALEIGVGGEVSAEIGAEVDDRYAPPILLEGEIESILEGDVDADVEVVVRVGSIRVIVTNRRKPYHQEEDFTNLGLDPRNTNIVVVKIGYLVPELYNMRKGWIMALTPGGVDQDLERLPYKRLIRPIFPLDKDMEDPDLEVVWIPESGS